MGKLNRLGFSLIEIMIVIAIIGLLVSIAVPNWLTARMSTRAGVCRNNMRQIYFAAEQYLINNNTMIVTYPVDLIGSTSYLSSEPLCPADNSAYLMTVNAGGLITVSCGSSEHGQYDGEFTSV